MDLASIIEDLASPSLCLNEVASRHGLTLEALSTYLASDQAQARLDLVQSTLAIHTRLAAQVRFPLAIAARHPPHIPPRCGLPAPVYMYTPQRSPLS